MASTASLSPLTTLSTPGGRPASMHQLGQAHRHDGIALGRLQDEGVAAGDAPAPNIHIGIMAGKLNGVMPATTPSGWRIE